MKRNYNSIRKCSIYFWICSIFVFGCTPKLIQSEKPQWDLTEVMSKINDETVYFVDYQKQPDDFDHGLNPDDIGRIIAYFENDKNVPKEFQDHLANGVVMYITKEYSIQQYRDKLSKFSKDYYQLVKDEPINRDKYTYIINGELLKPNVEPVLASIDFRKIRKIEIISPAIGKEIYKVDSKYDIVLINSKR